ncbi:hypothetical protein B0T18DRAFT_84567 [Schizothecium vesticola]|uniref:Uncharacterized protein n=1 Tax=Schizothecium vesticola TaxID=314040 RepID=A0AA40KAK6_9PEZI|nr:hypothetical protein B0T18DRAFT_84567 [Schizothecium vesticola]
MNATVELPPGQTHVNIDDNVTIGGPSSLNGPPRARSVSPSSHNSPGRARIAREAAHLIYSGFPQHRDSGRHRRESPRESLSLHLQPFVEYSGERPKNAPRFVGKKARTIISSLARRVRNVRVRHSSGVRDAPSWHQPLGNGSDKGGKKFKEVAPPPPFYYPPCPNDRRLLAAGSTHSLTPGYSRSSAPSPEERSPYQSDVDMDYGDGHPIPRCPLARQRSSHATHLPTNPCVPAKHNLHELSTDSSPPTKRPRLHSLTNRWSRATGSGPSLTGPHTTSTSNSSKSALSRAVDVIRSTIGRRSSEASGSSARMESSRPSFQHVE